MKAVAYLRKSTSGVGENGVEKQRRIKPKATFTEVEAGEEFPPERIAQFEGLLADGLFNLWLKEKGFSDKRWDAAAREKGK